MLLGRCSRRSSRRSRSTLFPSRAPVEIGRVARQRYLYPHFPEYQYVQVPSLHRLLRLNDLFLLLEVTLRFPRRLSAVFLFLWCTSLRSPLRTFPALVIFLRAVLRCALRFFCLGLEW